VNSPLALVVTIDAGPGTEQAVESALLGVVAQTRDEDGCIQYDLHRDPRVPGRFVFYETWASQEALDAHDEADHIVALKQTLEEKMAKAVFLTLDKIEP
jgi:quinol monooxygenase YgiN